MFCLTESFANLVDYSDENEAVPRIISFSSRKSGWKYGRGTKPCVDTIVNALLAAQVTRACGANKTGAFLNEDGTILVTGYYNEWHCEILCLLNGDYRLVIESNGDDIVDEQCDSLSSIAQMLTRQVQNKQENRWGATPISVFTTSTTTTSLLGAFKVAAFPNPQTTMECQSYALTAPLPPTAQSVDMREQATRPSANRRFFGNSHSPIFRVAHA